MVSLAVSRKGRIYTGSEAGEIYRWKNAEVPRPLRTRARARTHTH